MCECDSNKLSPFCEELNCNSKIKNEIQRIVDDFQPIEKKLCGTCRFFAKKDILYIGHNQSVGLSIDGVCQNSVNHIIIKHYAIDDKNRRSCDNWEIEK